MAFGCFWKFLTVVALIIQNMIEKNIAFDPSQKKNIPRLVFPLSDGQNGLGRTFGCCNEALVVWFLPSLEMQQPGQPALEIAMPGTSTKANQPWISALTSPKSRSYNPKIQQKIINGFDPPSPTSSPLRHWRRFHSCRPPRQSSPPRRAHRCSLRRYSWRRRGSGRKRPN